MSYPAVKVLSSGPISAKIMIVGEAPGSDEVAAKLPFVGSSGKLLTAMLADSGIDRSQCFITNVCKYQPPNNDLSEWFSTKTQAKTMNIAPINGRYPNVLIAEGVGELHDEICRVDPNLIIALGDTALWALTGKTGIVKWRGSTIPTNNIRAVHPVKVIPTYHPAAILRNWSWKTIALHDLAKCKREAEFPEINTPNYHFIIRPCFEDVIKTLSFLKEKLDKSILPLSVDLETRAGHIACTGIAWSKTEAICIPLMCTEDRNGYWKSLDVEFEVVRRIIEVIRHPHARIVGQNFLYDSQYISLYWGRTCNVVMDTMISHHVCWPGTP